MEAITSLCVFCYKQCGEVITTNSQSKNRDCSRFLVLLLRYLNMSPRATSDLDLSKEICEDCRTIGNAFCDLYVQLEGTRLQLQWKVRKIFDMMRCADKVPSRFKAFENQVLGETRNGRVAHHNKVKRMRAEVYNNCKVKITSGPPSICLTKYVDTSGPEDRLDTRVQVPAESFPQSDNISSLADAPLGLQQSIRPNDIRGEVRTKSEIEMLQEWEASKDIHDEITGAQQAGCISGTHQSAENKASIVNIEMERVSRNTQGEGCNGNEEIKPPKAPIITEIGDNGIMESSNLKRISVDRSTHTDKTDENEDKWSKLPEEEPVPIEVIIKLDNKHAKLEDSDEDFHLSEVEYENSSDEASSDERKFNMARQSLKHNPSNRDRGSKSVGSSKQSKREQVKSSTSLSSVNVAQQPKRELSHKCSHCGDLFWTTKALSCHLKDQHRTRKEDLKKIPYKCSICRNTFQVKRVFESHMLMHKSGSRNFQCTLCERIFSSKNLLKIHMKAHGRQANRIPKIDVKRFCCHLCKKRFKENSKLTQHKLAVHNGSNKLKKCMTSQKLAVHRKMHVRKKSSECKCHICSKTYVHSRSLLNHMKKIHNAAPGTTRKKAKAPNKGISTCPTTTVDKIS